VKESAKKAAEASRLKRLQMKQEREQAAGNQEPVIEFDTEPETRDQLEEVVAVHEAVEEPVEEPGQEPYASEWSELDHELANEDEQSASEDGELKAGPEEEEPVERPIITKDLRV
jgi:hypothetical protein